MDDKFNAVLEQLDAMSSNDIQNITKAQFIQMISGLTPEQIQKVIFHKNVRFYEGINGYVVNFIETTNTLNNMIAMPENDPLSKYSKFTALAGAAMNLTKMRTYEGITEENKIKVENALAQIKPHLASLMRGFQGGSKKKISRRSKKSKKTMKKKSKSTHKKKNNS